MTERAFFPGFHPGLHATAPLRGELRPAENLQISLRGPSPASFSSSVGEPQAHDALSPSLNTPHLGLSPSICFVPGVARVQFEGVSKSYGAVAALRDFSLEVADGECIAVLGPSGCGKSTLLRVIAGLESLSGGRILIDGERIDALPPQSRDVAMVFQSYALYPHLTVRQNIEFPLRMRGMTAAERQQKATDIGRMLELEALLDRRPAALSGGQRQRVALARALVRQPRLFLLDEPLSNLDARLRASVRQFIRRLQRRLRVTTLYVTHDQVEALTLGDRVVVLRDGLVQQVAPPETLYAEPATVFVASFIGSPPMNLLEAGVDRGAARIGELRLPIPDAVAGRLGSAANLVVGIRPEALTPVRPDSSGLQVLVEPDTAEIVGGDTVVRCRLGDQTVAARVPTGAVPERLQIPVGSLHWFGADGKRIG